MKKSKFKFNNIIFLVVIILLIIPKTRQPIQVFIHKGLALFSPSTIESSKREIIYDYNWKLVDIDGNTFNFQEAKNKVVFVSFWATWCPPCIAEMPSIDELYSDYKDDVIFLFVSNEKNEIVEQFLKKNNYSFGFYKSMSSHPEIFEISSIPRTYIIAKNGEIVIDKNGAANWNSDKVRHQIDVLLAQ